VDMNGAVLAVEDVTRRYRRGVEVVTALDGVGVGLYPGELTVAAGPSGSGKTTLLSVLAGLEVPDRGRVRTGPPLPPDVPPGDLPWRYLAFLPQSATLLDELTVAENVDLPARLDPAAGPGWDVDELLDLLEIAHLADRYPSRVSGGEQQRVALARALRLRPAVLLADEPTGQQDRGRVDLVMGVLRRHAYAGNVVLATSHDQAAIRTADRLLGMADGRLVGDSRAPSPTAL
jgi:ABC-type lipoprotein export system ATPase subunit